MRSSSHLSSLVGAVLVVLLLAESSSAFVVPRSTSSTTTLFGYRHEWGEGGGGAASSPNNPDNAENSEDKRTELQQQQSSFYSFAHQSHSVDADYGNDVLLQQPKQRGLTIPVLPSTPGSPPLMLGAEMVLDPPTLGQWQTLEESVTLHQNYLQGANLTAIDAAPVVAVIDDYTVVQQTSGNSHKQKRTRYATIAAVVGIGSTTKKEERSFMEIMMGCDNRKNIQPLSSRIRLVGVGRAELTDYFYQMPTELADGAAAEEECDIEDIEDLDALLSNQRHQQDPVVMAEFNILSDTSKSSIYQEDKLGCKGAKSPNMAPVFAITEMSKYCNKVTRLHDDRRRLVNLLISARMRLEQLSVYEDVDGISSIFYEENLWEETDRLMNDCENYGLNYYASFSSIPDLTHVAQEVLKDYYSPTRRSTEEHRLEVLSFVAFRSLQGFVSPEPMAWALAECTNSMERLQRAYEIMLDHYWSLKAMVKEANEDLIALGQDGCLLDTMDE